MYRVTVEGFHSPRDEGYAYTVKHFEHAGFAMVSDPASRAYQ